MSKDEKLKKRFLELPSDFTFSELETLLSHLGYEKLNKGKTSGSRVLFKYSDGSPIMVHKPHSGNIVKQYALKQILEELKKKGLI